MKQHSFSSLTVLSWLLVLTLVLSGCAAVDTTEPTLDLDATPTMLPEMEGDAESAITDSATTTDTTALDTTALTDTTTLTDATVSAEATTEGATDAAVEGIVTTALGPDAASVRLSSLLGQTIFDLNSNELGQIEDAVVAIGSGDIVYLITSGNDENGRIPLPVGVLSRTIDENQLVLDVDPEVIAGAPRLPTAMAGDDETTAPSIGYFNAILEQEVFDYWAATGAPVVGIYPTTLGATTNRVSGLPPLALEASDMVGRTIMNRDEEEIGTLEDAIYEANALRYAILSLNGADGRTVIPLYGLIYDIQNESFILDVTVDELTAAPGFTTTDELDLQNVDWSAGINDYWDTQVGLIGQLGVRVLASTTLLAENIIGSDVLGAEQEDLGDIEDMIVDPMSGDIRYAVLSFGGFLGIGEDYFAIPLDQLIIDPYGGGFSTSLTEEQLDGAPSFGAAAWPDFTTSDWDADFRNFWRNEGEAVTDNDTTDTTGAVRLSELLDNRVIGATDEDLGSVEDILIDFFRSQATYYVLNIGGFLDIGEKEIAVPWAQPSVFSTGEPIQLDVTEDQVDSAPEFDADVWPTVSNTQWLIDADNYWAQ